MSAALELSNKVEGAMRSLNGWRMSGGKSQTVSPSMVMAGDISLPLSHIGSRTRDFMAARENTAPRPALVPYRKRTYPCCAPSTRLRLGLGLVRAMFRRFLKALHSEDRGQDLAEYCLLTALVALIALGIFVHVAGGVQAVWSSANTSLTEGHAASTATPATAGTPASSGQPASTA